MLLNQIKYNKYFSIVVIGTLVTLDIVSKWISQLYLNESYVIFNGYFSLDLVYNEGIAFSMPLVGIPLVIVTFIVLSFVIYLRLKEKDIFSKIAIDMVLAGGIGNMIERVGYGRVTDFISIGWWPVFNIADSLVVVGVVVLIIRMIIRKK